jgi:negative regulator of flagellin synthesis FlgM
LDEIPDVREDKVAELKNQIQNGTYQPDAQKTADKLLKEQLGNAVIEDKLDI